MENKMLVAQNHCPFDGPYGQICFRLCANGESIVLMCNECDAVWLEPEHFEIDYFLSPQPPDFLVPGTNCSVGGPKSRWASKDEVSKKGWSSFIVGETEEG
jgi:hypothetical protein